MDEAKFNERVRTIVENARLQGDAARANIQSALEKLNHAGVNVDVSKELTNLQQIQAHYEALTGHLTAPEAPLPAPPGIPKSTKKKRKKK